MKQTEGEKEFQKGQKQVTDKSTEVASATSFRKHIGITCTVEMQIIQKPKNKMCLQKKKAGK